MSFRSKLRVNGWRKSALIVFSLLAFVVSSSAPLSAAPSTGGNGGSEMDPDGLA